MSNSSLLSATTAVPSKSNFIWLIELGCTETRLVSVEEVISNLIRLPTTVAFEAMSVELGEEVQFPTDNESLVLTAAEYNKTQQETTNFG